MTCGKHVAPQCPPFPPGRARRLVAAFVFVAAGPACREATPADPAPNAGAAPATPVEVAVARDGDLTDDWKFLGEVRALARATLAAGAAGAVRSVHARVGDAVPRGALLVEVDPDLASARVRTTRADLLQSREALAQAEREVRRLTGLSADVIPEIERERARSRVRELGAQTQAREAALAQAQAELSRHRVEAPFDGIVAERRVDTGDWVSPGDPVLELVSTGEVEVIVEASRVLLGATKPGDSVDLVAGENSATGRVTGLVPALDPVSRTLRIRVVPNGPIDWLVPGDTVSVAFTIRRASRGGVIVPVDALVGTGPSARVVRVDAEERAAPVSVEVLAQSGGQALVKGDGLVAGTRVVVRGNERARPGQPVTVMP